jgi:3'-phosphoadenosine 5'-phosphosulfate sulfotransferase (PAPS reductase)/FAD synthetase
MSYLIDGPAMISFSGGRTSAFMLHEILRANDGLPPNVHVIFANTGKEREETLRFVHECSTRWSIRIRWVEWRHGGAGFAEVGYNSASRKGEPFERLIAQKQRLPNSHERWCTQFLKVLPMFALMRAELGLEPGQYTETIGLRDDEGLRILNGMERAQADGRVVRYPLAKAKVRKAGVMSFWLGLNVDPKNLTHPLPQGFDLGLNPWEGNCDLCFQKGKGIRKHIIRNDPTAPIWWADREREQGGWFDKRDLVSELVEQVRVSPTLFDNASDDFEYDVECGTNCGVSL